MKKLLTILLALSLIACLFSACSKDEADPTDPPAASKNEETKTDDTPTPDAEPEAPVNPNLADFVDYVDQSWDINEYYNSKGVECEASIRGDTWIVNVPDTFTTEMPTANEKYKIGFSLYYSVDEVGAMIMETVKASAEECGIELLTNDANYDQNLQNQAVEQWILEGVDGVIICPCDFYGVQGALDALKEADIPVVVFNPALSGEFDSVCMSECCEQGEMAAQLLIDHLLETGSDMKGVVVYQTLPFTHPNAATRSKGFIDAFAAYPDIEIVELTGTSPEEHYTAFEGALMNYGDELIGAFGLYSSATIGMMNAAQAAGSDVPITSIDNDKVILEGIYEGKLLGSCCYSSTAPIRWCLSQLINKLNGAEIPNVMFYANTLVTKDNVEEMFEFYYNGKTLADYMAGLVD